MTKPQRYKRALAAVEALTQLGTTPDGGVIVGPQGWQMVLEARQ